MIPSWLTAPLCVPVAPKGSGFGFLVSSAQRNDASAESLPCAFPIPPSNRVLKQSASFVLTSLRSSTYPRGYASGSSLAAVLLDGLFELPVSAVCEYGRSSLTHLFVPEHSQRSLAENPVGAGKTHDQCEQHREEEADPKHLWVDAPREVEYIPNQGPCQDASKG